MSNRDIVIERMAVMQAYLDGRAIECCSTEWTGGWRTVESPRFDWGRNTYRVKEAKPDQIMWEAIDPKWKWMARDANGYVYLYDRKPYIKEGRDAWHSGPEGDVFFPYERIKVIVGDTPWNHSLVERPEGV